MPSYDPQNIFAKILRGELPCHKVYEDDKVLAFLDIMPRAPGHTLVLPKAPCRNILDIAPDDLAAVALVGQRVAVVDAHHQRIGGVAQARSHITEPPHLAQGALQPGRAVGGDQHQVVGVGIGVERQVGFGRCRGDELQHRLQQRIAIVLGGLGIGVRRRRELAGLLPHIKSARVRALGVTTLKRNPQLPDVPTLAESGLPGFDHVEWWVLVGPARMPEAVETKVHRDFSAVVAQPEFKNRMLELDIETFPNTRDASRAFLKRELARWARDAKALGMTP